MALLSLNPMLEAEAVLTAANATSRTPAAITSERRSLLAIFSLSCLAPRPLSSAPVLDVYRLWASRPHQVSSVQMPNASLENHRRAGDGGSTCREIAVRVHGARVAHEAAGADEGCADPLGRGTNQEGPAEGQRE